MQTPGIQRVAVVGLGLIGGSVLLRLAAGGVDAIGYDAAPKTLAAASERLGPAAIAKSLPGAIEGADLVVLAVPLTAVPEVLTVLAAASYQGLLTDVTSVKRPVLELATKHLPDATWVGGHPMAGKESSGFDVAEPSLFEGCAWALCLEPETDLTAWRTLAAWVTGLGARAVPLLAAEHDAAVARISHLPHLVAAALTDGAAAGTVGPAALGLAAGSFRDATRVAGTRTALTAAMCGGNAHALTAEVDALLARLTTARTLLTSPDPVAALDAWLAPAHTVRTAWPPTGTPVSLPAGREELIALGRAGGSITAVHPDGSASGIRV